MMEEISLGNKSDFKTLLKILRERTAVTAQDASGKSVPINNPVAISARMEHYFYAMLLWIKMTSAQRRPLSAGTFNALLLKEYRKLYHDKKYTGEEDTNKIVTNPERFIKKMCFLKWLIQLYN